MPPNSVVSLSSAPCPERTAAQISIAGLSVAFADQPPVLNELSLEIPAGEIVALVGASGCGKSTLLRAIAGLISPKEGAVSFAPKISAQSGQLAFVFQSPTLLPWRSVDENIALPLEIGSYKPQQHSATQQTVEAAVAHARQAVELTDRMGRQFPRELSGGMQMRVSIARAIVTDPSVLLLDEPFAALDDILRNKLNELLLQQWNIRSRTIVFVTHNIAESVYLSHRVIVMGGGTIASMIDNRLAWPRRAEMRASVEFAEMYGQISSALARVQS